MKVLTIVLLIITDAIFMGLGYWFGHDQATKDAWSTVESHVFAQYGGGDAGVEQMLYLKTGVHQDFMGNPYSGPNEADFREYQLELTDTGTYVYDSQRFVGFLPFDSTQAFDKLMLNDNL